VVWRRTSTFARCAVRVCLAHDGGMRRCCVRALHAPVHSSRFERRDRLPRGGIFAAYHSGTFSRQACLRLLTLALPAQAGGVRRMRPALCYLRMDHSFACATAICAAFRAFAFPRHLAACATVLFFSMEPADASGAEVCGFLYSEHFAVVDAISCSEHVLPFRWNLRNG